MTINRLYKHVQTIPKWLVDYCFNHIVGTRPLDGRGVLLGMGGVGWGGACINVHANLHMK